ncbi:MAG TPA: hypothetical protein VFM54_23505 [Micromonosporaceae bacterium]|nr:hypothetical protein [Micromonosporaceae bacterium]
MSSAVFTGAGISGDPPAWLPRGFGLRDDVLRVMYCAAAHAVPDLVTRAQLDSLTAGPYKLEVVLGRLWGVVGPDALQCLLALRLEVPNEAHMLAALHLAHGGLHVTVNFDVGIEMAYDLLMGEAELPAYAPGPFHDAVRQWRRLVPPSAPPLTVVSSHDEFVGWTARGRPCGLLKIHGSLRRDQRGLVDVVVVDIEELAQLTDARLAAVTALRAAEQVLVTGYSGADPDVYAPLLAVLPAGRTRWCCYSLPDDSVVRKDAAAHGIDLVLGPPDGLATTALRDLPGTSAVPSWPDLDVPGDRYEQRFNRWAAWLRRRHPAELVAQSWAWLLSDLGDLDAAEAILARLTARSADPAAVLRRAEILYNRARGDDRDRAGTYFRQVRSAPGTDTRTRHHCTLRLGDIARGDAVRQQAQLRAAARVAAAYLHPLRVLVATGLGRRDPESGGDAYRALQQTSLRVLEQAAVVAPRPLWPLVGLLCRVASRLGYAADRLVANGNRRALVRHHRLHLQALAGLLRPAVRTSLDRIAAEASRLRMTYHNADDLSGAANCAVTLALVAAARGDRTGAAALLAEARAGYCAGRPDQLPLPSGAALIAVITRLLDRSGPAGRAGVRHPAHGPVRRGDA